MRCSLKTDYPFLPSTGSEILIKISHVALNPVDVHLILNVPVWLPFRRLPGPSLRLYGEIVAAGPAVPSELSPGTEVCSALTISQVVFGKERWLSTSKFQPTRSRSSRNLRRRRLLRA